MNRNLKNFINNSVRPTKSLRPKKIKLKKQLEKEDNKEKTKSEFKKIRTKLFFCIPFMEFMN